uniref:Phosphoheptose isomerase n=1 Tax=Ascaris lumbricoides TaxID=6252 RepID=A0A0M3I0Z9_ASCLU
MHKTRVHLSSELLAVCDAVSAHSATSLNRELSLSSALTHGRHALIALGNGANVDVFWQIHTATFNSQSPLFTGAIP